MIAILRHENGLERMRCLSCIYQPVLNQEIIAPFHQTATAVL